MAKLRPIEELENNSKIVVMVWDNPMFGRQVVEGWRDQYGILNGDGPLEKCATHFVDPDDFTYEDESKYENVDQQLEDFNEYLITLVAIINTVIDLIDAGEFEAAKAMLDTYATVAYFNSRYVNEDGF